MNARLLSTVRVGLTAAAMTLCGALALSTSAGCAGDTVSNGSGGTTSQGGQQSNGGSTGNPGGQGGTNTGGDTGTTPSNCPADPGTSAANFCDGKAQGALTGYAYISLGVQNSASDPLCAEDPNDLTKTRPITAPPVGECEAEGKTCPKTGHTVWSAPDKLCITGTMPKVTTPAGSTSPDYKSAWGLQIGVNTGDPPAADGGPTLGEIVSDASSFQTIALTTEGTVTPTNNAIRVVIHLKEMECVVEPYCATMSASDKPIVLTSFNTECWNGSSCGSSTTCKQLKPEDLPNIDKIGVQISADTSKEYKVENYCLKAITFAK